ncbi:uncharacterized protein LOC141695184 [Apium graveolens]|uniref:uncharacterized protein LOC141695184 n=1 Tax=Apium graveolens TaxID=4045 RepID=UPI003D7AD86A
MTIQTSEDMLRACALGWTGDWDKYLYLVEFIEKLKERLKEARSLQKSYVDQHKKFGGFEQGDHVFLKVSPFKVVKRFGIKGKLSPRGYKYHSLHVVQYTLHKIREDLFYEKEAGAILAREERVLRKNTIPFVKVLWKNQSEREATRELKESICEKYPHLFESGTSI